MFERRILWFAILAVAAGCTPEPGAKDDTGTDEPVDLDVVTHPGGTIGDETWVAAEYVLDSGLYVEGRLVVEPCTVVRMPAGSTLMVSNGGSIEMRGTAECPITITSAASSPSRGDWNGLEIYADAANGNVLEHVIVEYAGAADYGAIWLASDARLTMRDSTVRSSSSAGLHVDGGADLLEFAGNTLTDNASFAVRISAEDVAELGAGTYGPNDEDGVFVRGGTVADAGTWLALDAPYVVAGVSVEADLTIEAGAELRMNADAVFDVYAGGLHVAGTEEQPVTFRSSASAPTAGDWGGIWFYGGTNAGSNVIEHAVVEHSGGADYGSIWIASDASVAITDVTVRDGVGHGVWLDPDAEVRDFTGNTITELTDEAIRLSAGQVHQIGAGTYDNGVRIVGGTVDSDVTWAHHGVPYIVPTGFDVRTDGASAHLTIAAGAELRLGSGAGVVVGKNGGLALDGTAAEPVVVTSSSPAPLAGDWGDIEIFSDSHGAANVFRHAVLRYGGSDGYGALYLDHGATITLEDVTFEDNEGCDLSGGGTVQGIGTTYTYCG